jgi:DNA mismatch repair protein MutS
MVTDPTTLADLEVFRDSDGGGGLFALLDETETVAGRVALRRRFQAPGVRVEDIRRVQEAVTHLMRRSDAVAFPPGPADAVRRYLDSNTQVSGTSRWPNPVLEGLWTAARYRDVYREVRDGVYATRRLVEMAWGTARRLVDGDAPTLLEDLARDVLDACEALAPLLGGASAAAVVRADTVLRGGERHRLEGLVGVLGELDALRSMARATRRRGWTIPELVDSPDFLLEGEGLWHPFLARAVTNPIALSGGEPLVFLTGPNMAGKTTYLRCTALAVLLAQIGMGVPASRLRLTPVEVLLTGLNPADNLRAGLSFFLSEVLRVRAAAEVLAAGRRAFVLFDEVFKGTNVKDALEASETVILGFARARGSGFIFSSHLVELVDTLRADPRVRFHYFDGRLVEGRAEYSYQVRAGVSEQRFGLQLLSEARIPELIERIGA